MFSKFQDFLLVVVLFYAIYRIGFGEGVTTVNLFILLCAVVAVISMALKRSGALDSDAPILLTGWSLGGMMAGDIATDPRLAGRVESVVTAGSAIDKHAGEMDPSVRVTQVNNRWDPVHTLEFVGYGPEDVPGPNWQTYHPVDIRIHDANMYGELADDLVPQVRPGDEKFFADDVKGTYEQVYEMEYSRG